MHYASSAESCIVQINFGLRANFRLKLKFKTELHRYVNIMFGATGKCKQYTRWHSKHVCILGFRPKFSCLQCFDAVGWVAGRASGLEKTEL